MEGQDKFGKRSLAGYISEENTHSRTFRIRSSLRKMEPTACLGVWTWPGFSGELKESLDYAHFQKKSLRNSIS